MYFTKENCQQIYGKYSISFTIREMPIKSMMGYSGTPVERRKMERKCERGKMRTGSNLIQGREERRGTDIPVTLQIEYWWIWLETGGENLLPC